MAKTTAPPSAPRNRSRKKSGLPWPAIAGGVLGLFIVSFLIGMYGLPRPDAATPPEESTAAEVEAVALVEDRDRVKVTELPGDPFRRRSRSTEERRSRKQEERSESQPSSETPTTPASPPAVTAPVERPAPTPSATPQVEPPPPEEASEEEPVEEARSYRVQAGAFEREENARAMADQLASSGYQPSVTTSREGGTTYYRVQVGPFPEKTEAENAVRDLGQQGISARVAED